MSSAHDLLQALPIPAILLNRDGRIADLNGPAEALFGSSLRGRHHVAALRQPKLLDAAEEALAGRGASAAFVLHEGGRETSWSVVARPLNGGSALLAFEDRTAGDEVGQVRRDFVANVSHELKTPITALLGYIETLRGPARDDASARERFLGSMALEATRMSRLVSDLLSLSRVEAEGRVRPRETVDLVAVVRRVTETLVERIGQDAHRIALDLPASAAIVGDRTQLEQVVSNLLENAIRYAPGAPIALAVTPAQPEPALRGEGVRLTVRDEGPGIAAHHVPRLTERFYRVDDHRSREIGGTGLGLAIVKHIVARHRGRFSVESAVGMGSTFTVVLPAAGQGRALS